MVKKNKQIAHKSNGGKAPRKKKLATEAKAKVDSKSGIKKLGGTKLSTLAKEEVVDLIGKNLTDGDVVVLLQLLQKSKVVHTLKLSRNQLTLADGKLADALAQNCTIKHLWLRNNCINDVGAIQLADALKTNKTLISLLLTGNSISSRGTKSIANALLVNGTLESLFLNNNQIGDKGAEHLARVLMDNGTLKRLEISGNGISVMGAESLELPLKDNETLDAISLANNRIGDGGADHFAAVLIKNKTLQELDLSSNDIGQDGAESLAYSLTSNETLDELKLGGNNIRKSVFADLEKVGSYIIRVIKQGKRNMPGKINIIRNRKKKANSCQVNQTLPETSLELSLQGTTKTQEEKIAALEAEKAAMEAELDSKTPNIWDLTGEDETEGIESGPPPSECSSMARLLMQDMQKKICVKEEAAEAAKEGEKMAKKKASAAKRMAEVALQEKEDALEYARCQICFEVKDEKYLMVTCGHTICFDCFYQETPSYVPPGRGRRQEGGADLSSMRNNPDDPQVCPFCKTPLKEEKKKLKRVYDG